LRLAGYNVPMADLLGKRLLIVTVSVDESGREIAGGASERRKGKIVGVADSLVTVELDGGGQQVLNTREIPIVPLTGSERRHLGAGRRRQPAQLIAKQKKVLAL